MNDQKLYVLKAPQTVKLLKVAEMINDDDWWVFPWLGERVSQLLRVLIQGFGETIDVEWFYSIVVSDDKFSLGFTFVRRDRLAAETLSDAVDVVVDNHSDNESRQVVINALNQNHLVTLTPENEEDSYAQALMNGLHWVWHEAERHVFNGNNH